VNLKLSKTNIIYWILEGEGEPFSFKDLRAEEILSPHELACLKKMRFEKRRNEYLFGRYTAKRMLTSNGLNWSGEDFWSLEILNEPDGAPYLEQPNKGGSLSITHRGNFAASALFAGEDRQIGIDLEIIEPRDWSFVEDFFTEIEVASVKRLAEPYRSVWVTTMWSAKEAVLKAWRKGLRIDTRDIEIKPITEENFISLADDWVQINAEIRNSRYPACWLFGRVFGDYVLPWPYPPHPQAPQPIPI